MNDGILPVSTRPRSVATHHKVLDSTNKLLREVGFRGISIERIAEHSGVSTATLYKHWPTKNAIVAEAFGRVATEALKVPTEGDPLANLIDCTVESLTFHSVQSGRVFFQLLAACSLEPHGAAYFDQFYLIPRRKSLEPVFARALASGQLAEGLEIDVAMDVAFGAAVFRLMRDTEDVDLASIEDTVRWSVRGLLAEQH
ncbi:TetR/AcrR family transcriptional regulator [Glutamicibacter arilaitensis]|uniref:TetR/AcrR family transcriptional regulator n=1 Tax=Glutamicibacter arilaitensis TaxID=256701 RepID=UPI00384DFA42